MTITITGGRIVTRGSGLHSTETLAQSTATAVQAISVTTNLTNVGMGTATGFGLNRYTVSDGTEGQRKIVSATATGEAKVLPSSGTATGGWVLSKADDFVAMEFFNSKWHVVQSSGATLASST